MSDTSREAVERLLAEIDSRGYVTDGEDGFRVDCDAIAATLRALLAERDAALQQVAALREALQGMLSWQEQRPKQHAYDTWQAARLVYDDTAAAAAAWEARVRADERAKALEDAAEIADEQTWPGTLYNYGTARLTAADIAARHQRETAEYIAAAIRALKGTAP